MSSVDADEVRPGPAQRRGVRKHVTRACIHCRRLKTKVRFSCTDYTAANTCKCDGVQPCQSCIRLSRVCDYPESPDGRNLGLIRQERDELKTEAELLNDLLATLLKSPVDVNLELLQQIRQHQSVESIKGRLNDYLKQCEKPQPNGFEDTALRTLRITRLTDNPSYSIRSSPWTRIIADDALASHLLSLFLTWDELWDTFMDKSLFLTAVQQGVTESYYCSPFLFNIIMAYACPYSDWEETRTRSGQVSDLSRAFLAEARRLLEQESASSITLPVVQGMPLLILALALSGNDRDAYFELLRLIGMCEELQAYPPRSDDPVEEVPLSAATDITCWGIFNFVTASMLSFMRPNGMIPPLRARPPQSIEIWSPYPLSGETCTYHRGELFNLHCETSLVGAGLLPIIMSDQVTDSGEKQVLASCQRIAQLISTAPDYLRLSDDAPAPVLTHYAWSSFVILRASLWLVKYGTTAATRSHAHTLSIQAALSIADTFRVYRGKYGYAHIHCIFTQSTSTALYTLLGANDAPEVDVDHSQAIILLFSCLRALSRRFLMSMGILRSVQLFAKEKRRNLPETTQTLLQDFESKEWQRRKVRRLISTYPQPLVATNFVIRGSAPRDMGRFLEQMDALSTKDT